MFKKKFIYLFMVLAMLASMIPIAGAVETPQAASEPALAMTQDALTLPKFEPPAPAVGPAGRIQGDRPGIMEQDRQEALDREQPPGPPAPKRPEPKAAEAEVGDPVVFVRGSWGGWSYQDDNYVSGEVPEFCDYGTVTLKDSSGTVKAQNNHVFACWDFSVNLTDIYGNPADIEAGDTVEAAFGGQTTVVDVPVLEAEADPDTDLVEGVGPANDMLDIWLDWPSWWTLTEATDASGNFSADFTPFEGVDFGSWGYLRYEDADGNQIYEDYRAPYDDIIVNVRGDWSSYSGDNYVRGEVPDFCDYGTVTLTDSGGAVKDQRTDVWACGNFSVGLDDDIEAGDRVVAAFGDQTTIVGVPAFDVTSDPDTDTLTGNTNAYVTNDNPGAKRSLALWPQSYYDGDSGKQVLTDGSGDFTAANPFYCLADPGCGSTNLDWWPGDEGHLRYINGDGNQVYGRFFAFDDETQVWVHKDSNNVHGRATGPDLLVTVTLENNGTPKATGTTTSYDDGWFEVGLFDDMGNRVIIEEGDTVTVEASDPVVIEVPELTGQADFSADTVSGTGPADSQLQVTVEEGGWPWPSLGVVTDANGDYRADFSGIWDIQPGDRIRVDYQAAEGQRVFILFQAGPQLKTQLHDNNVWGFATAANIPVSVTLKSGTDVKAVEVVDAYGDGWFEADLYSPTGQRALVEAGDTIEVAFGDGSTAMMTAADLTAELDPDTDTVSGTGPADTPLGLEVEGHHETVLTDASGDWTFDASGVHDIQPGDQASLQHKDANLNETWLESVAAVVYVRSQGDWPDAYEDDNFVSGYAPRYATVDITLKRGGETIATRRVMAYSDGYYEAWLEDSFGLDADIMGGDQIIVEASPAITVAVPVIEAEVDAETNTVSGTGPANASLGLWLDCCENQTVETDASGNFEAEFDNIWPGADVTVRYVDSDGNWIYARFRSTLSDVDPRIDARWDGDEVCQACVAGHAGVKSAVVELVLKRGGSTVATASGFADDYSGWFSTVFRDDMGEEVAILDGDTIEMTAGGATTSMTVVALTAQANEESGVLYGTGPADEHLCWWYDDPWDGQDDGCDRIAPDGTYNFEIGLPNQAIGYVRYEDLDSHMTYLGWAARFIRVAEQANEVNGFVEANMPVEVTLLDSGGGTKATAMTTSDGGGWFYVTFWDPLHRPIRNMADDTVVVQATETISVPVVPLEATVDIAADKVTGSGPADDSLDVWVNNYGRFVTTAADGSYTADYSDELDIKGGNWVNVHHRNEEGNEVFIWFRAPMIRVNQAADMVDGYTTPLAEATLTLKRGGSTVATTTAMAEGNGFFTAFFTNAAGALVDIKAGDTVEVTASPSNSVTVVSITASINTSTEVVSGTGPANADLFVRVWGWYGWDFDGWEKAAKTGADGKFSVDYSDVLDLDDASYVYVHYIDAKGNQSAFNSIPAATPLLDIVEGWVLDEGAMLLASTYGVGNDEDLSPPMEVSFGGGGDLLFVSRECDLVITHPNGTVNEPWDNWVELENAAAGKYLVQVRVCGAEGTQYAMAAGKIMTSSIIYLPIVMNE